MPKSQDGERVKFEKAMDPGSPMREGEAASPGRTILRDKMLDPHSPMREGEFKRPGSSSKPASLSSRALPQSFSKLPSGSRSLRGGKR